MTCLLANDAASMANRLSAFWRKGGTVILNYRHLLEKPEKLTRMQYNSALSFVDRESK